MKNKHEIVAEKIAAIEAEMKRIGMWQETPLSEAAYRFTQAFAMDTMAFSQWLQFVFIPRVKQIVAEKGTFPTASMVAAQAVREFDTDPLDTSHLQTLLSEFDRMFG
jgi:uncharacterized protein YqcC (DUF446 family)